MLVSSHLSHQVGLKLTRLFSEMSLVHGYTHADPHPGNLMVRCRGERLRPAAGADRNGVLHSSQASCTNLPQRFVECLRSWGVDCKGNWWCVVSGHRCGAYDKTAVISTCSQDALSTDALHGPEKQDNCEEGAAANRWMMLDLRPLWPTTERCWALILWCPMWLFRVTDS